MNKEFFKKNRQSVMDKTINNSIVVVFAGEAPVKSADEAYPFTPNRNFYYLTGINKENIILLMVKNNNKVEEFLYVEKSDPVLEKWVGKKLNSDEAKEISGVENIGYIDDFNAKLQFLLNRFNFDNLYLDLERRQWTDGLSNTQVFAKATIEKYPYLKVLNIYGIISEMRTIKTKEEVEIIKEAIEVTKQGIYSMMKNSKPGMMEYELEAYFDFELKRRGITDYAFKTIAASGINGTVLHYSQNNSKIGDNDLILFDLGAQYKYYASDISRTIPITGKFTERQKQIYNIVLKAQLEVLKIIKPGLPYKELNLTTRKVFAEELKKIGLIKEDSEVSKYYFHGVSHHLGLDTHDVGVYGDDLLLKPGMVFTVEPGLYIEEEAIGIRIEDDVLVTEDGYENLSKDILKTVEDIEYYMS